MWRDGTRNGTLTRRQFLEAAGALGVTAAAGSILTAESAAGVQAEPRRGGTLAIGTDVFPVDLVPSSTTATATTSLVQQLYEGLVAPDPATGVGAKPGLAESWQVSADGKVYTFKLRRGVKFHDGTDFTSEAVVLNFERLRNPQSPYFYKTGHPISNQVFSDVERAEAVDPYTCRYYLKSPNGDLVFLLKRPYAMFVSPAVIKRYRPEEVARHPIGTGPFRLVQREEGSRVVFERFDAYWGGAPYLDRLVYRPYGEPGAREAALLTGEVDLITYAQLDSLDRLKGRYVPFNWGVYEAWITGLNTRHPIVKDVRVRQALNYAVDREALVRDLFKGQALVAKGPYSPSNAAFNPALQGYTYDPDRARKLLAEAGYANGLTLKALMPTNVALPRLSEMGQSLQADLRKVGVEVTYETLEWTAYLAKIRPGLTEEYAFYTSGWGADFMVWLEQMLSKRAWPPNGPNRGWYANPEVDALFDAAREERDEAKRKALYRKAEDLIVRDAPWLFSIYYSFIGLHSPKLRGLRLSYIAHDFSRAWLDA